MESQKQRRPVQRGRKQKEPNKRADAGSRQICLPLTQEQYDDIWDNPAEVRKHVDQVAMQSPELFPEKTNVGYQLSGKLPASKKMPHIQLRQVRIAGQAYYLRPSFVMPSFTGTTDELRIPMELIAHGVAFWIIVKVFGRDEMFWLRQQQRLGRNCNRSRAGLRVQAAFAFDLQSAGRSEGTDSLANFASVASIKY